MPRSDTQQPRLTKDADGAASIEAARRDLAERLRARRAELEESIVARVRGVGFDPALGEDAEYISGARAAIAESVDYGLMAIERGDEWIDTLPAAAVAQARHAASHGVSLDRVLLRSNAGHSIVRDFVMQEAERIDSPGERAALRHVLRTLGVLLDHFTSSIAREYQEESERMARTPQLRRAERIQRLLAGATRDAGELDYDFEAEHVGMIAMGPKADECVRALAAALGCQLLSVARGDETVWAWLGGRRAPPVAEIDRLLSGRKGTGVSLVLGAPASGIEGWRLTHRQAQAAMAIALRSPQPITCYADVALLAAVLKDRELAQSLVEINLAPLGVQKDGDVARETLRAYFAASSNAATAAAALGVDRHTVERRLNAIETRMGRLLHTCQAELQVALRLEELGDIDRIEAPASLVDTSRPR